MLPYGMHHGHDFSNFRCWRVDSSCRRRFEATRQLLITWIWNTGCQECIQLDVVLARTASRTRTVRIPNCEASPEPGRLCSKGGTGWIQRQCSICPPVQLSCRQTIINIIPLGQVHIEPRTQICTNLGSPESPSTSLPAQSLSQNWHSPRKRKEFTVESKFVWVTRRVHRPWRPLYTETLSLSDASIILLSIARVAFE